MKPGSLAAALVIGALICAAPAYAVDIKQRPAYLPPPDGMAAGRARLLSGHSEELIVAVRAGERGAAIMRAANARDLGRGLWLVAGKSAAQTVRRLETADALRYASRNQRVQPLSLQGAQGDPLDPAPWWAPHLGADRVAPPTAPGYPITIIDDGIDSTHPEFAGRSVTYLNENSIDPPDDMHGTMVSSVAAAPVNGVGMAGLYPNAALRSFDLGFGSCADALEALDTAMNAGESVINMSWTFTPRGCPPLYERVIQAFGTGSLLVAAAGNDREEGSPLGIPAMLPHVLTVGATNSAGTFSYFSNQDIGLDLAAPGERIMVATPTFYDPSGYSIESGTSFSAPLVSAAAAWVATQRPGLDNTQLFDLLRWSARDIGPTGWDSDTGFGMLDLPSALSRGVPAIDRQEPNDDIDQVKAHGLFVNATPPITRPGHGKASFRSRLDFTEDPVDVYRVWVPGHRVARITVTPDANVQLEAFRPSARTVYYENRRTALHGALIGGSYKPGRGVERFAVKNSSGRGSYIYVEVSIPESAQQLAASYNLTVSTRKR
jgi:Subtilase family